MMDNVSAHLLDDELSAYLLGQLPDVEQQAVEEHLDECRECETRAAEAAPRDALVDLLHRAAVREVPAAAFSVFGNTVSSRIDSTPGDHPSTVIAPEFTANAMSSPPAALTGNSRYRVLRLLGCGGMGSVWLAEHLVMGRPVALKVIRPELLAKDGTLERFRREVQAAAKLNHPNIAHAYDAEQIGDSHFLVMEFVPGHTLSERVKAGPLPISIACQAICDAAFGLAHAHAAGLVHRDVKPGNLIQTDDGTVKVLDFGLAISAEADSSITGENLVMGTPDYVAPEQAEDPHAADARSDIYSLGCTLYHLLSGRVPFVADSMVKKIDAHRFRDPEPIAGVPQSLWLIVAKMMAKPPAQRFQSALEVAAALEPFCHDGHDSRCHQTSESNPSRSRSRETSDRTLTSSATSRTRSGRVAMLLASLALLLGVVVYRIQTDKGELVITADDDAEISIKQGGKEVTIYDTKSKQKLVLDSGTYELELKGKPTGLKLDIEKATLTRGGKAFARIERVVSKVAAANVPLPSRAGTVTDFREVHGADLSELQQWLAALPRGFQPSCLTNRAGSHVPRFDAIAIQDGSQIEFQPHLDLDRTGVNHMLDLRSQEPGWMLRSICTYRDQIGFPRHHLWVKDPGTWFVYGVNLDVLPTKLSEWKQQGYRPTAFYLNASDPGRGNSSRPYGVLLAPSRQIGWEAFVEQSADQLNDLLRKAREQKRQPEVLSAIGSNLDRTFAVTLVPNPTELPWEFRMEMSVLEFETAMSEQKQLGRWPLVILSEDNQGAIRYMAIWVESPGSKRHSLLLPSSIGDGGDDNYRVEGQLLKIDTLTRSNQLWLNYVRWQATELELHCPLRITDVSGHAYFKLVLLSDNNSELSVLFRKQGSEHNLLVESYGADKCLKILADRPIAPDFAKSWIDTIVILKGAKVQFFADGELLLEAECHREVKRYVALAAFNCRVELRDPVVLVPTQ